MVAFSPPSPQRSRFGEKRNLPFLEEEKAWVGS